MTLEEGFFHPSLDLPLKYVLFYQKERMLSSHPVLEEVAEDWDCLDCGGPPPDFHLPPPPCPPDFDVPWTCPAASRGRGLETTLGDDRRVSIAVVVVTAATFVLLAIVAAVIVCRRRLQRENRGSKSPPMDGGAIIYDDLTGQSVPAGALTTIDEAGRTHQVLWTPLGPRSPPRYVHAPSLNRPHVRYKMTNNREDRHTHHHHLRQPGIGHAVAEPLYQTISSGSGSSRCPSEGGRMAVSSPSPRLQHETESEEDDSLTPFLKRGSIPGDDSPLRSPCHARYYLSVPLGHPMRPPSASSSTHTSSHEYETLPLRSGMNGRASIGSQGRPLTPQERGLPPLPSRSERFRMFLPQDKGKEKRSVNSRTPPGFISFKAPTNSAGSVIYENIGLSSHL